MKNKLLFNILIIILLLGFSSAYVLATTDLSINPPDTTVSYNDQFIIMVNINSDDSVKLAQLDVNFNPTVLQAISQVEGGFLTKDGDPITDFGSSIDNINGKVKFNKLISAPYKGVNGSGSLVNITFKAIQKNNVSNLTLDNILIGDWNATNVVFSITNNGTVMVVTTENVLINEFQARPFLNVQANKWIELYYNGSGTVDLTNWKINDSDSKGNNLTGMLNSSQRYIVFNSNDLGFSLEVGGEILYLYDNLNNLIDNVTYGTIPTGEENKSRGRKHDGLSEWILFNIPTPNAANNRLSVDNIADKPISEDTVGSFIVTNEIIDPDSDPLTFSIAHENTSQVDCNIINKTNVTLEPAKDWNGVANCIIRVDDGYGIIDKLFYINVKNVNDAPEFNPALKNQTVNEDSTLTYDINATDIDVGDVLSFTSNISVLGGKINKSIGVLIWTPDNDDVGSHNIEVTVCDDSGAVNNCTDGSFVITVINTNDAPTLAAIADQPINEDSLLQFYLNGADIDLGDTLTYSCNLTTLNVNKISNILANVTWTPTNNYVGNHSVNCTVRDAAGEKDSKVFAIEVKNTNDDPVLASIGDKTAVESLPLTFKLSASDEDPTNDALTFGTNASFNLNSATGAVTFTPTYTDVGVYDILFNVSDGKGGKDKEIITLTVNSALEITDLDITVDTNSYNNLQNEDIVDARPGSAIQADIELKNMINVDIRGVIINGTLDTSLGLFKKSSLIPNIAPQQTDSVSLQFELPNIIGEKLYPLEIRGRGEDENHIIREVERTVYINVSQKGNEVLVENINLTPNKVGCIKNATLRFDITNKGKYDQINGNTIKITNKDLGIDIEETFSIPKNSTSAESYPLNITTTQTGTFPLKINVTWFYVNSIPNTVNLEIVECIGVPDHSVEEDTTPSSNWIDLWSYISDPNYAPSNFTYNITQSNESLINCSVISGRYVNCSTPAANQSGYSDINVSVTGSFTNYDVFRIKVNPVNDPPAITTPIPDVIFDEGNTNNTVDLDDYVFDVDNSDDELIWSVIGNENITVSINPTTHVVTFATINKDWYGSETITFTVSDKEYSDSQNILVTVIKLFDDSPYINSSSPKEDKILIGDGIDLDLSVSVIDPDYINYTVSWYVNGTKKWNGNLFTFNELTSYTYEVIANLTNTSETESYGIRTWYITVSEVPVTNKYKGTIKSVGPSNVSAFPELTIYNDYAKIDFGNQTIDLSEVVDVDSNVRIEKGIVGINSNTYGFDVFKIPATITMYGLSSSSTPSIYYNNGFEVSGTQVCDRSTYPSCDIIGYNETTGTLIFEVSHFTIFFLNNPPKITSSPVTTAIMDELYKYDVQATDPENDPLTYSLTTKPNEMSISSNGVISWTPKNITKENVTVSVSDGTNTVIQSFIIEVVEGAKLRVSDLDVKVADKISKDLSNGATISRKAKPGDKVKFDIEVENLFSSSSNIQIEAIEITVTIEGIDDGDDLEESADMEDLDAGDDDSVTLEFTIPPLVEEDIYDVIIEVDGEDENGKDQEVRWELKLEVKKDKHALLVDKTDLSPSSIKCDRNPSLDIKAVNIGGEDEDEVLIEIRNDDLVLDIEEKGIELEEGNDEDSVFEKTYKLDIDDNIKAGTYPITIKAYYDSKVSDQKTVDLVVEDCLEIVTPLEAEPVEVITTPPTVKEPEKPLITKISFRDTTEYLVLLTILFAILFGGVIFLIGAAIIMARKR